MSSAKRNLQFLLWVNRFERDALDRIVGARGYRNASEALRDLIRREDPARIKLDLTPRRTKTTKAPGATT